MTRHAIARTLPPASGRPHAAALALGALGVVFGDVGTSPLYALRECFHGPYAIPPTPANIRGVLSLIFWALIVVIAIKYVIFVMRADNRGEGGILALTALIGPRRESAGRGRWLLAALGIVGAALLYGDGMITPAISVLSAVEGLRVAAPLFEPYVIPLTLVILVTLFLVQRRGTGALGAVFGPVTLVWFGAIALLGARAVIREPGVIAAIDPHHAVAFLGTNRLNGFLVLSAVFLVVTGGEALYADMGHFGTRAIRTAWFAVVLPALLLNYFGQGALLMVDPSRVAHPFYGLVPAWAHYPMVGLATAATVIASQAVISGAFSMTAQAVRLGYLPRVEVAYTSPEERGQVYAPLTNYVLMLAAVALVLGFRSSGQLAAAYGVAVAATMAITTILAVVVARKRWHWPLPAVVLVAVLLGVVDLGFLGSNLIKLPHGGWFPLAVAAILYAGISTWRRGRQLLAHRRRTTNVPIARFLARLAAEPPARVPGTAVYMSAERSTIPAALVHNLTHNKVLHERIVLFTVVTADRPRVPAAERVAVEPFGAGLFRVVASYGFMQRPNPLQALHRCAAKGLSLDPAAATFFLGRETFVPSKHPGMARWRVGLFILMARNARYAPDFFRLPSERVVELGVRVSI